MINAQIIRPLWSLVVLFLIKCWLHRSLLQLISYQHSLNISVFVTDYLNLKSFFMPWAHCSVYFLLYDTVYWAQNQIRGPDTTLLLLSGNRLYTNKNYISLIMLKLLRDANIQREERHKTQATLLCCLLWMYGQLCVRITQRECIQETSLITDKFLMEDVF